MPPLSKWCRSSWSAAWERGTFQQETCHLLLQLPMFRASRDFVFLSLDGSREVGDKTDEGGQVVTVDSQLDHYSSRPNTPEFKNLTLLKFVQRYKIPKRVGDKLFRRKKEVVVIIRPYCLPNPNGPKYHQYCKQKMMMHQSFRQLEETAPLPQKHTLSSCRLEMLLPPLRTTFIALKQRIIRTLLLMR